MRLQALSAPLRSHFLLNALNAVAMPIRGKVHNAASEMVLGYGELLRSVMEPGPAEVPLRHGMASIHSGGVIAITARRDHDVLRIVVRDNGGGYPRRQLC